MKIQGNDGSESARARRETEDDGRKGVVGGNHDVIVERLPGNGKRSSRRDADARRHRRPAVKINLDLG